MKVFAIFCAVLAVASAQSMMGDGVIKTQSDFYGALSTVGINQIWGAVTANADQRRMEDPKAQELYQPVLDTLQFTWSLSDTIKKTIEANPASDHIDAFKAIFHTMLNNVDNVMQWADENGASTVTFQQRFSPLQQQLDAIDMHIESLRVAITDGQVMTMYGIYGTLNSDEGIAVMTAIPPFLKDAGTLLNDAVVALVATFPN